MNLIFKLLTGVVVVGGLTLPFTILKGDDGNTLLSISDLNIPDISFPDFSSLGNLGGSKALKSEQAETEISFYKWIDIEGNVQFGNNPPAHGIEYTVKKFNPNENVIPAVSSNSNDRQQVSGAVLK
jgi:hypothetical protein